MTPPKRGRPSYPDQLTPAEWQVVEAVRHGLTNRQIAMRRGVSIDAVKYHIANILPKLGLSRRAELRHWTGIARHSALNTKNKPIGGTQMTGQIGQISRKVADIKAAWHWYGNVLGLEPLYAFGEYAFFDCGGVRLFLSQADDALTSDSILYFQVDDIHAAHVAMTTKGIDFINAPHMVHRHGDGTEEWMAFFKDNDGRSLAIMSQARP